MQSPPAELAVDLARALLVNLLRARGDADGDTWSEKIRELVDRCPHGRPLLYVGVGLVAIGFIQHIDRPLRR